MSATPTATRADRDLIDRLNGFFVGMLSDDELESFERCIVSGYARRKYEGGAARPSGALTFAGAFASICSTSAAVQSGSI